MFHRIYPLSHMLKLSHRHQGPSAPPVLPTIHTRLHQVELRIQESANSLVQGRHFITTSDGFEEYLKEFLDLSQAAFMSIQSKKVRTKTYIQSFCNDTILSTTSPRIIAFAIPPNIDYGLASRKCTRKLYIDSISLSLEEFRIRHVHNC